MQTITTYNIEQKPFYSQFETLPPFYAYVYYCPLTKDPVYVGSGTRHDDYASVPQRVFTHLKMAHMHMTSKKAIKEGKAIGLLYKHIQHVHKLGLCFTIVIHPATTRQEAYDIEEQLIRQYGRLDIGTGPLFNQSSGPGALDVKSIVEKMKVADLNYRREPPSQKCREIVSALKKKPVEELAESTIKSRHHQGKNYERIKQDPARAAARRLVQRETMNRRNQDPFRKIMNNARTLTHNIVNEDLLKEKGACKRAGLPFTKEYRDSPWLRISDTVKNKVMSLLQQGMNPKDINRTVLKPIVQQAIDQL